MYNRKEMMKINKKVSKEIVNLINEQIWLENNASFYYLHLSIEFESNGFGGMSKFFSTQSTEERYHMLKLIDYLLEEDCDPILPNYNFLEDLKEEFDVLTHFENSLMNEKRVTESINKIIDECKKQGDYKTENFMQWFVTEQREEETKFKTIIDDLKIIGGNGSGLYEINKELGKLSITEEN